MKIETKTIIEEFFIRNNHLESQRKEILDAINALITTFKNGGKLLVCGNGGSSSDSDHIVGELMKGFNKRRPLNDSLKLVGEELYGLDGKLLIENLQGGLPAISLTSQSALITAFLNDCNPEYVFAQQVNALINETDCLLAISTSGNSKNVVHAVRMAKIKNANVISLLGKGGGILKDISDISIVSPEVETFKVQEDHLPVYHLLCLAIESELF